MLDDKNQLITHQTGTIISHRGYPQEEYRKEVDSTLRIKVDGVLFVSVEVLAFNLETKYGDTCYDYLHVNNDIKYCAEELNSASRHMYLVGGELVLGFITDDSDEQDGFKLTYQFSGR